MKEHDIVAVGESLVDFLCTNADSSLVLEGNAGGAPANVMAMASKLGLSTAIISKVGADSFGHFIRSKIKEAGIDDAYMLTDTSHPTTIAVVSLDKTGNRNFGFYRDSTADVMLEAAEIPYDTIERCKIFHFGSVSMTAQPSRTATLDAVRHAKKNGVIISFDPNLRRPLWRDEHEAKEYIEQGLQLSDLVKLSDDELYFLTEQGSMEERIEQLWARYSFKLLIVTLGADGCMCRTPSGMYSSPAFDVPTIDTTGAGDAFWGACLYSLLQHGTGIDGYTDKSIKDLLAFANAAGSLSTTKKGAIPSYPRVSEISALL